MLTFLITPPQDILRRQIAQRLMETLPQYHVVTPENQTEVADAIADADAVYGWISPELLPVATKLRWLQSPTAGPQPGYYYQALIEHLVVISNLRGIYNDHIAQHIMQFVLALARGLPYYVQAQQQQRWDPTARKSAYIDLKTATALIVGVGGIGHETARLCAAFGMHVIGVDARWEHAVPFVEQHSPEELDALLPCADFVIVTIPHTPETEGMWNIQRFECMKSSAYFINIGRGMTTKLDDLVLALERGTIAGAALDVFEIEPLPSTHTLWTLPNVLLTPHIAVRDAANIDERHIAIVLDNARRFAVGEPLRNVVDKASWY